MRDAIILILFLFLNQVRVIHGQTCCSGVLLTGNLGLPSAASGTWPFSPSYGLNYMNTLKQGKQTVEDQSRRRLTQSLLFETGYSISDRLYISGLFLHMSSRQGRSDMGNADGIIYNADLQPGTGAWDVIAWGLLSRQGIIRPSS